jgi:ribosomal subunit interface protein
MKISTKYTKLESTPSLQVYIEKKFAAIERLVRRFDEEGVVDLVVELARVSSHHHKGDVYRASARLSIPKKNFIVKEEGSDARLTLDHAKDTLKEALERYAEKLKPKK